MARYAMWLISLVFVLGCGDGQTPSGPKQRRNEERPIQREIRQLRQLREAPAAPSLPAPTAALGSDTTAEDTLEGSVEGLPVEAPIAVAPGEPAPAQGAPTVGEPTLPDSADVLASSETPSADEAAADEVAADDAAADVALAAETSVDAPVTSADAVATAAVVGEATAPVGSAPIELTRVIVASAVENREPAGVAPFASAPERVYLFLEVQNPGPADRAVRVVFEGPDGSRRPPVELAVPTSRRWRTWANARRLAPGSWTATVTDESGQSLATRTFEIPEASTEPMPT